MNNLSQYQIIGITGIIGAGKSFVSEKIKEQYQANIIEIDHIRRDMLWFSLSDQSVNLRKELIKEFSINKYDNYYFFDRKSFTKLIFSNENILKTFNLLCKPYFCTYIKDNIIHNRLNCIVWVNLIEEGYIDFIQHLIFVDIPENKWKLYNKDNLQFILARYSMQEAIINKKKLLNNLTISYEVYTNE